MSIIKANLNDKEKKQMLSIIDEDIIEEENETLKQLLLKVRFNIFNNIFNFYVLNIDRRDNINMFMPVLEKDSSNNLMISYISHSNKIVKDQVYSYLASMLDKLETYLFHQYDNFNIRLLIPHGKEMSETVIKLKDRIKTITSRELNENFIEEEINIRKI